MPLDTAVMTFLHTNINGLRAKRRKSEVAQGSVGRVDPPAEMICGCVSRDDAHILLRAVQELSDDNCRVSKASRSAFGH